MRLGIPMLNNSDRKLFTKPGDEFRARIGTNGRKIATYKSGDGSFKASRTSYKNGTIHETRTYKS